MSSVTRMRRRRRRILAEWSRKVEDRESRGLPGPEIPKIRKLFPPAPTPPRFKSKKRCQHRRRGGEEDGGVGSDVEDEDFVA